MDVGAFWFRVVARICLLVIALWVLCCWLVVTVVIGLLSVFVDAGVMLLC